MLFEDKIKQFEESDFELFRDFIKRNFHKKYILTDFKFLKWQYGSNSRKKYFSILLLKEKNNLYGCLGNVVLDYKVLDRIKKTSIYMNLFVDPALRSLGLGTPLINEAMKKRDAALNIAYNPETASIYQKLGNWQKMGKFFRYLVIFNSKAVANIFKEESPKKKLNSYQLKSKNLFTSKTNCQYIKNFNSDFNLFWKTIRQRYQMTIERTAQYLNWRYANHPYFKYFILTARKNKELVGCLIYRIEKNQNFKIGRIIDFISSENFETDLLKKFILDVQKKGVDMADFMFGGNYYHKSLKTVGFFEASNTIFKNFPILFNPISYKKPNISFMVWTKDKNINQNEFYNPSNWYLTKGDSDQDRPNPH